MVTVVIAFLPVTRRNIWVLITFYKKYNTSSYNLLFLLRNVKLWITQLPRHLKHTKLQIHLIVQYLAKELCILLRSMLTNWRFCPSTFWRWKGFFGGLIAYIFFSLVHTVSNTNTECIYMASCNLLLCISFLQHFFWINVKVTLFKEPLTLTSYTCTCLY